MKKFLPYLIVIVTVVLLGSCSAQWHLSRAIKKDPSLIDTTMTIRIDTIQLPPLEKVITEIELIPGKDSIIIRDQNGIVIRILKHGDFATVECECPPPTMYIKTIEKAITLNLPPDKKEKWNIWWRKTRWMLIILITILLGWKFKSPILNLIKLL